MAEAKAKRIRVLVADDHLVVRMGLKALLALAPDIEVVGEASDGRLALRLVESLAPDVVIMDLMMPKLSGADATARIVAEYPATRVLVLTTFSSSADVKRALDVGAIGAVVKDASHEKLLAAIRNAHAGRRTVSPEIERNLESMPRLPELSDRQLEILSLVAKGFNNLEIARLLDLGRDCVKAHLKTIFARLNVSNRSEAAASAVANGLIRP